MTGFDAGDGRVDSLLVVAKPGADMSQMRERAVQVVNGRAVVVDPRSGRSRPRSPPR